MAGLLQQGMQQPSQQGGPQNGQQGGRRTHPQQAVYAKLMNMLLQFLYSQQGVQAVQQGLQMGGEPDQNIGTIVGRLVQKMLMDAGQQGKQLPPLMVMQATIELSQAVTDMATEAGAVPQEQANAVAKNAFYEAMTIVGQGMQKTMAPEERQQYQQGLQRLSEMDQQSMQSRGAQA